VVPPLRDRRGDVPGLAEHFLRHFAATYSRPVHRIPARVIRLLSAHDWPGNVRELRNVIERAVIVSAGPDMEFDPVWLNSAAPLENAKTWAAAEKARILEALKATGGRIYGPGGAAHRLGLRPTTLYGKMRKHGLTRESSCWQ
jgi:formate hydrogenlyase transcriptional activator